MEQRRRQLTSEPFALRPICILQGCYRRRSESAALVCRFYSCQHTELESSSSIALPNGAQPNRRSERKQNTKRANLHNKATIIALPACNEQRRRGHLAGLSVVVCRDNSTGGGGGGRISVGGHEFQTPACWSSKASGGQLEIGQRKKKSEHPRQRTRFCLS